MEVTHARASSDESVTREDEKDRETYVQITALAINRLLHKLELLPWYQKMVHQAPMWPLLLRRRRRRRPLAAAAALGTTHAQCRASPPRRVHN